MPVIRFIHFADLHIGVETYGRPDAASGLSTRMLDFLGALDELVDRAIADDVDLVLFAGDAFKTREPTQTQQREFARRIRRLVEANIPVFLLIGNHDLPSAYSRATALEIYDTLAIPRVTVRSRPGVSVIETKSGPVQIAALPWMNISQLLTRDEYKNLSLDQIDRLAADRIKPHGVGAGGCGRPEAARRAGGARGDERIAGEVGLGEVDDRGPLPPADEEHPRRRSFRLRRAGASPRLPAAGARNADVLLWQPAAGGLRRGERPQGLPRGGAGPGAGGRGAHG